MAKKLNWLGPSLAELAGCNINDVAAGIMAIGPKHRFGVSTPKVSGRCWYNLLAYPWADLYDWAQRWQAQKPQSYVNKLLTEA